MHVGLFIVLFILFTAAFFTVSKGFGLPVYVTSASLLVGLLSSLLVLSRLTDSRGVLLAMAWALPALVLSLLAANLFFDLSSDGTRYHQDAIIELTKGFNFLRSSLEGSFPAFTNNYPKLSWFYSSSIYELTGNIHLGKSINFLLMISVWALAHSVFTDLPRMVRGLAATALAANPIILSQLFTHYVDGALGAFLTISILGLYGLFWSRRSPAMLAVVLGGIIGCASLKHTGLVFSSVMIGTTVYLLWKRPLPFAISTHLVTVGLLVVTGLVLTINPYLKNIVEGKHIFHPSLGEERVDLMRGQTTRYFSKLDPVSKLVMSVLGKTENENPKTSSHYPTLKVPFTVHKSEIVHAKGVDVRWGGWGPLFGGVFLVAIVHLLLRGKAIRSYAPLVGSVAVLSVINPESWWARLNPQLYVLVIFLLLLFYLKDAGSRWAVTAMLGVLILNSAIVMVSSYRAIDSGNSTLEGMISDVSAEGASTLCWEFKARHLEPILEREEVDWAPDENCAAELPRCAVVLGETICGGGRLLPRHLRFVTQTDQAAPRLRQMAARPLFDAATKTQISQGN